MNRRAHACYAVALSAQGLLHDLTAMCAEIPGAESRDRLDQAGRIVGALATWAHAWGDAYTAHTAELDPREVDHV